MANFKSYMHVERLSSQDCEGLLDNDNVVVTAKVDATNACVWYDPEQNRLRTGSRKREINLNKDNAGLLNGLKTPKIMKFIFCLKLVVTIPSGLYTVNGWRNL